MAIFDWRDFERDAAGGDLRRLAERYRTAEAARGGEEWLAFLAELLELAAGPPGNDEVRLRAHAALDRFMRSIGRVPPPSRDTVFVSHQRNDAGWAERVAWLATEAGFEYWLDIHDPALGQANVLPAPPPVKAALIAGIIEMALLNCTHLVSLQTPASRSSRWVPYEFGRAKERALLAVRAASWFRTGTTPDPQGDYLSLAFCAMTKTELRDWLDAAAGRPRPRGPNRIWRRQVPADLPN